MAEGEHPPAPLVELVQRVPLVRSCDVLVVGGGPSGIAAATAAARAGADTILVERHGSLGGNNTAALIGPFMPSFSADGSTQIVRGVFDELVRRMEALGGAIHPSGVAGQNGFTGYWSFAHDHVTPFQSDALRLAAAQMLLEAGAELRLHSLFADPLMDEPRAAVTGVTTLSKAGWQALAATVTIDCTGDADVAHRAGVATVSGRPQDGRMMPMTLFCRVSNVDRDRLEAAWRARADDHLPLGSLVADATAAGRFPIPAKSMLDLYLEPDGHHWRLNMTKLVGRDGTSVEDLTGAQVDGLGQVFALLEFLRAEVPGFGKAMLVDTGAQVYVRETRRIVGEYVLTGADVASGRAFDDAVAHGSWPIDIPQDIVAGSGSLIAKEPPYAIPNWHSIPYRSLVPLGVDQLLVAGRALSATHEAAAAVRVEPPCFAMGQAAGTAAAMAVAEGIPPRRVDAAALRRRLVEAGAFVA